MTENEKSLRDCLVRTAKAICQWTGDPLPPLWRSVLKDIYETLRDASVAILENTPYPPEAQESPEAPEPPTVVVGVYGGLVQWVQKTDAKIRVIVRDYDCDGQDELECGLQRDGDGHLYAEWEER